ncbi:MAG: hypothetical protein QXH80_04090 [Candidatus Nanoarchaeia archaeon]
MNKKAAIGDAFDILFTIIAAVFIYFFISIILSTQLPQEEQVNYDVTEANSQYMLNQFLKARFNFNGKEISGADACNLLKLNYGKYDNSLSKQLIETYKKFPFTSQDIIIPLSNGELTEVYSYKYEVGGLVGVEYKFICGIEMQP